MVDETGSTVDLNSLLKGVNMGNLLGGTGNSSEGLGGGLLLGLLLGRTNLLGGDNTGAAALAADRLTAADVQNIVAANTNSQTLGNVEGEIWKAEGQLQAALAASTNAAQIATLNGEIANLQGQGVIVKAVTEGAAAIAKQGGEGVATTLAASGNVINAVTTGNTATAAGFGVINTNIAQSTYATSLAIANDGEKTRASIAALAASIPNARELDLQRQLAVALDDHRHTATRGIIDSGNVNVTTNVAQAQSQAQLQQQAIITNGLLGQLIASQQATNTAVTIGNGNRPTQTANNVA
jgi:hypothetical protein